MPSTPSIHISHDQRHSSPPPFYRSISATASPMTIPRARDIVPPPLPPPTYIPEISAGQDPGWQWGNDPNGSDFGRPASVKPGSSLLGGTANNAKHGQEIDSMVHYPHDTRRGSSISTVTVDRDSDMHVDNLRHNDDDGNSPRPMSNHEYVNTSLKS